MGSEMCIRDRFETGSMLLARGQEFVRVDLHLGHAGDGRVVELAAGRGDDDTGDAVYVEELGHGAGTPAPVTVAGLGQRVRWLVVLVMGERAQELVAR